MSWDDSGVSQPHDSEATCRGGYRVLPKSREFEGHAASLRMLHYHGFGDIGQPTCVSPFFTAAPSKYDYPLGHSNGADVNRTQTREVSAEASALKQHSAQLGKELAEGPGHAHMGNPMLANSRGLAHNTSLGSPFPHDNVQSRKSEAAQRVAALQSALHEEPKGLAKCYA